MSGPDAPNESVDAVAAADAADAGVALPRRAPGTPSSSRLDLDDLDSPPPHRPSRRGHLVAYFETPAALVTAAEAARAAGYTRLDGHTPMPVHGLAEALGQADHIIPKVVFVGGLIGGLLAFFGQWLAGLDYPLEVAGRPLFSWPAFVIVTFECTVLGAALSGFGAFLWSNGLPRPHHPVFDAPGFERALVDRYALSLAGDDPRFDAEDARALFEALDAIEVVDVP